MEVGGWWVQKTRTASLSWSGAVNRVCLEFYFSSPVPNTRTRSGRKTEVAPPPELDFRIHKAAKLSKRRAL